MDVGAQAARQVGESTVQLRATTEHVEEMKQLVAQLKKQTNTNDQHRMHLLKKVDASKYHKDLLLSMLQDLNKKLEREEEDIRLMKEERENLRKHRDAAQEAHAEAQSEVQQAEDQIRDAQRMSEVAKIDVQKAVAQLHEIERVQLETTKRTREVESSLKRLNVATTKRTIAADYYGTLLQNVQ